MADSHTYTDEYRRECADLVIASGRPATQMADEIGVNRKTLQHWVQRRKMELEGAMPTADPELKAAYDEWRGPRSAFQARVAVGEPDAVRAGWQRDYIAGRDPAGSDGPTFHRTKRVLPKPVRSALGGADVAPRNIADFILPLCLKTGPRAAAAFAAPVPGT